MLTHTHTICSLYKCTKTECCFDVLPAPAKLSRQNKEQPFLSSYPEVPSYWNLLKLDTWHIFFFHGGSFVCLLFFNLHFPVSSSTKIIGMCWCKHFGLVIFFSSFLQQLSVLPTNSSTVWYSASHISSAARSNDLKNKILIMHNNEARPEATTEKKKKWGEKGQHRLMKNRQHPRNWIWKEHIGN